MTYLSNKMTSVSVEPSFSPSKAVKKESFFKRTPKATLHADLPCQGVPEDLFYFNLNPESFDSTVDISVNTDTHKKVRISTTVQQFSTSMLPAEIAPFYQTAVAFAHNDTPLIQMLKDQQVMYAAPVYIKATGKLTGILIGWELTSKLTCPSPKDFIQACASPRSFQRQKTINLELLSAAMSESSSSEASFSSYSDESNSQPSPQADKKAPWLVEV